MTGLEIFEELVRGQTVYHRCDDAWDLLNQEQLVVAVICPRIAHVSISPTSKPSRPARVGR
jgi:hypothetical protein